MIHPRGHPRLLPSPILQRPPPNIHRPTPDTRCPTDARSACSLVRICIRILVRILHDVTRYPLPITGTPLTVTSVARLDYALLSTLQ
ncbi:hypothetical protein DENSPDRAFT_446446 [Dentipellis sp. KUC8613]|nr:hypothetical protein DENSPDRAFT_446446 [Dentipellis sp. KUC8613]